ncbi:GAF domain-containing protein [Roseiconus nitratireducens]|uniref:GAF domain-containing protein n=1 Tax=Roseiconus nitratireducens TaxID=2605748 RepID=A0A5M6CX92_9BACT|nr:GAF domain-containing protein [Roseiconus nitratireducens]KAA5539703.1 GAF domain-containing protein [Roseiconus nitratireducens]
MTSVAKLRLPDHSFLSDAQVLEIHDGGAGMTDDSRLDALVYRTIESGNAGVEKHPDLLPGGTAAVLTIPVYREQELRSLVLLAAKHDPPPAVVHPEPVGVFEVWEPVGPYEEVALASGYYGRMERFQNVSTFVRFERGNGLPGQVWEQQTAVIHDDLGNHPGFLRAAGASADLLQTAVGIPVIADQFRSSVLLLSAHRTPIARGFEVWRRSDDEFVLQQASYFELGSACQVSPGTTMKRDAGWAELLLQAGGAVLSVEPTILTHAIEFPEDQVVPDCGIAIPRFDGQSLVSFMTMLF